MVTQLTQKENSEITEAYTELFNLIQGFPAPLRNTWWNGAYRTLERSTAVEVIAAIKLYGDNAKKAHEKYMKRVQS